MTSPTPGEAAKTEADVEEAGRSGESRTKRDGKLKKKPFPTLVIIYLSNLHAILPGCSSCCMNLDSTCMEIKCLKGKYIKNCLFAALV